MMSKAIPPTEQGLLQGALNSLNSVAGMFGPLICGSAFFLFTAKEGPATYPGAGSPFLVGSVLCLLSLVPVAMIWKRMPSTVRDTPVEGDGEPRCAECGYQLRGAPTNRCPECGTEAVVGAR
jgi:DHA1 family tetracycline resistance protein-like MFS transporter